MNLVSADVGGYEWHYDHNPITAIDYVTDHVDEGELLYVSEDGSHRAEQARAGRLVFGDLSQRPHAVAPLISSPIRLCVVFGLKVPAFVEDDRDVSTYVLGES